jgi:DNA repair protein RadC
VRTGGTDFSKVSDQELLGLLLGARNAKRLYRGSLSALLKAKSEDSHCDSAAKLRGAGELVRRALSEELQSQPAFTSPAAVKDFLRLSIGSKEHEVFMVLFLDTQHALIAAQEMFRGTLSQTSVYPREVVKEALRLNAGSVILAHNHPSGVVEPSRADEHLTQTLKTALALVDVRVLDHVVVAPQRAMSMAERGLL